MQSIALDLSTDSLSTHLPPAVHRLGSPISAVVPWHGRCEARPYVAGWRATFERKAEIRRPQVRAAKGRESPVLSVCVVKIGWRANLDAHKDIVLSAPGMTAGSTHADGEIGDTDPHSGL